jgi:hypothetical protein
MAESRRRIFRRNSERSAEAGNSAPEEAHTEEQEASVPPPAGEPAAKPEVSAPEPAIEPPAAEQPEGSVAP